MITHNLGYPRIGSRRELKKANEQYWFGKSSKRSLLQVAKNVRTENLLTQKNAGIQLIPCNDFSYYDHVLDMSLSVGAIPERYSPVLHNHKENDELDLYFAMARGYQKEGLDITAMEMTKWFDTNYHYIVPEFKKDQQFSLFSNKIINEFYEAKELLGVIPKPVLLGPVSFLLLGKEKEEGFNRIDLLKNLLPVYNTILEKLERLGAKWVQLDEPCLVMNLGERERNAFKEAYQYLGRQFPHLKFLLAIYFERTGDNLETAISLPVSALHIDLCRCQNQLDDILDSSFKSSNKLLSLGLVDGRNIWKNDYQKSLAIINKAIAKIGIERLMLAPSCSLLHVPYDLDLETNDKVLTPEIKNWMAFAKQKLAEVSDLHKLTSQKSSENERVLSLNAAAISSRKTSSLIHKSEVSALVNQILDTDIRRSSPFIIRQEKQNRALNLPLLPTTTIGSFPQTPEIRALRAQFKSGNLSIAEYERAIKEETQQVIQWQEAIGLDVLVHGEYERNDMVEYFGELLEGFVFTENGWVQSYGSRCVKPPVIFGDVKRKEPMTVKWTTYAQSLTKKPVKGMLTGPVTILQWSFVRDDQPRKNTCYQIALAIRDEVEDLERANISIIQIDEPAIREGLPLRKENWKEYLKWAVGAFRVSSGSVNDETQIHTHMCYSEFNDILEHIADMDADVITIETSRSQMELLDAFSDFKYPNEIGPGVYDIHSPRVPTTEEMITLINKAANVIPIRNLWINPDCGLKTRKWPETEAALRNMVEATNLLRQEVAKEVKV
jgi:5-methyltetrahydropteroyltriglutamate--homocysteine methyltransferase